MPILTRIALVTSFIALFITLAACSNTNIPKPLAGMTECTEPRPQMCTMQYDPVCAQLSDGSLKTHATDCTACGKSEVVGYIKGACPE